MITSRHSSRCSEPIRVFLVDDHAIVRRGLASLLKREEDIHLCGEAEELRGAAQSIEKVRPDVVLVDLNLGGKNGVELLRELQQHWVGIRAVVVSQYPPDPYAELAREAGAQGYVCKEDAAEQIVYAVRTVFEGETYFTNRQ